MPVAYGLIEPVDLSLPRLAQSLSGLRIAHLTDLHIVHRTDRLDRLANQLTALRVDLIFFTGDYINDSSNEEVAYEVLRHLCARLHPTIGSFGVFGNHDTAAFQDLCDDLPVHWLDNQSVRLKQRPIEIMGLNMLRHKPTDAVALLIDRDETSDGAATSAPAPVPDAPGLRLPAVPASDFASPLRLMLAHSPEAIFTAADMGVDVLFCGHTHGGQIRLPSGRALANACEFPLRLSSGLLRCRDTLAVISRGLGEVGFPRRRLFCKPHAPLCTLHHRATPGRRRESIELLQSW